MEGGTLKEILQQRKEKFTLIEI